MEEVFHSLQRCVHPVLDSRASSYPEGPPRGGDESPVAHMDVSSLSGTEPKPWFPRVDAPERPGVSGSPVHVRRRLRCLLDPVAWRARATSALVGEHHEDDGFPSAWSSRPARVAVTDGLERDARGPSSLACRADSDAGWVRSPTLATRRSTSRASEDDADSLEGVLVVYEFDRRVP
jgi:hypothetical protein